VNCAEQLVPSRLVLTYRTRGLAVRFARSEVIGPAVKILSVVAYLHSCRVQHLPDTH
jgi:hypothetical protein